MATTAFLKFWEVESAREAFLSVVPKEDLAPFRLACHDFGVQAAPHLFKELNVNFKTTTFTKPARILALNRIGPHVRKLSFTMAHGPDTFLPPLLDPNTGEEVDVIYEPYCQVSADLTNRFSSPTYGSWEMTDLLVKQYPPLFHAAANVPSFIRALSSMKGLEHLRISCPDQEAELRYRRDIVDYALISLRIAVERGGLSKLSRLSLIDVHPAAVQYLNPMMGFGALPNSVKRWRQIRHLTIEMDTIPEGSSRDHLKLLHSYLQTFSPTLTRLSFNWTGSAAGPFPLSLSSEPTLSSIRSPGNACPQRCHLTLRPLKIPHLEFMKVDNVATDATQVSSFILAHRRSISEFNFEATTLREGSWDEALAPLVRREEEKRRRREGKRSKRPKVEVMECPLFISSAELLDESSSDGNTTSTSPSTSSPTRPLPARVGIECLGGGLLGMVTGGGTAAGQARCPTPLLSGLGMVGIGAAWASPVCGGGAGTRTTMGWARAYTGGVGVGVPASASTSLKEKGWLSLQRLLKSSATAWRQF